MVAATAATGPIETPKNDVPREIRKPKVDKPEVEAPKSMSRPSSPGAAELENASPAVTIPYRSVAGRRAAYRMNKPMRRANRRLRRPTDSKVQAKLEPNGCGGKWDRLHAPWGTKKADHRAMWLGRRQGFRYRSQRGFWFGVAQRGATASRYRAAIRLRAQQPLQKGREKP